MKGNQKWLWGGLGLLAALFICCFGVLLGSALSKRAQPTAQAAPAMPTPMPPVPTTSPAAVTVIVIEPTSTSTAPAIAPTPTNTQVVQPPTATHTPIVIVVTATPAEPSRQGPTPTPVPSIQPARPANDFQALAAYAQAIKPLLDEGGAAAERDSQILEASKENPDALCGAGNAPHPTLVADAALMDDLLKRLNEIAPPEEAATAVHKPLTESVRLWGEALDNINRSCQTKDPAARGLLRLGATLQVGGSMLNFRIAAENFWRLVLVNGIEAIVGTPVP